MAAAKKRLTKAQVVSEIAEKAELDKKTVNSVFDTLFDVIKKELSNKGPGEFVLPGLLKVKLGTTKARPARMGKNPQTGEPIKIPAKPASKRIRVSALKALKDAVL